MLKFVFFGDWPDVFVVWVKINLETNRTFPQLMCMPAAAEARHTGPKWTSSPEKVDEWWMESSLYLLPPALCAVLELGEAEEHLLQ